jgi:signal transduction histidine kinase
LPGAGIFGPLNSAAYLSWLAVTITPLLDWDPGATKLCMVAFVAQLWFAGLFLFRVMLERHCETGKFLRLNLVAQSIVSLIAVGASLDKMQAVLLVIVAAQTPAVRDKRFNIGMLAVANVVLFAIFLSLLPLAKAAQAEIAYLAFQLFAAMVADYAYRAHEAREIALRANTELLSTRRLLQESTRVEERLRLSRELHDVMGHKLTALKLQLALQSRGVAPTQEVMQRCSTLTDELLTDVRGVVDSLRDSDGIDLHEALRALDPKLPTPKVTFDLDSNVRVPDIQQAEAMLRCAQEGLTNALRHSGAAEVRLALTDSEEGVVLSVEDDGGYTPAIRHGNGLRGLQERLQKLGGRLRLEARAPRGLTLLAILPHA